MILQTQISSRTLVRLLEVVTGIIIAVSVVWIVMFLTDRVGRSLARVTTIETLSQVVPRTVISRALFERVLSHWQAKLAIQEIPWQTIRDPFQRNNQ